MPDPGILVCTQIWVVKRPKQKIDKNEGKKRIDMEMPEPFVAIVYFGLMFKL